MIIKPKPPMKANRDFISTVNWELDTNGMETPKGVSLTVPDMSMTLKEILEKSLAGMDMTYLQRMGMDSDHDPDFDDDDLESVSRMDFAEREQYIRNVFFTESTQAAEAAGVARAKAAGSPRSGENAPNPAQDIAQVRSEILAG